MQHQKNVRQQPRTGPQVVQAKNTYQESDALQLAQRRLLMVVITCGVVRQIIMQQTQPQVIGKAVWQIQYLAAHVRVTESQTRHHIQLPNAAKMP